jgi:hypothetical protein
MRIQAGRTRPQAGHTRRLTPLRRGRARDGRGLVRGQAAAAHKRLGCGRGLACLLRLLRTPLLSFCASSLRR